VTSSADTGSDVIRLWLDDLRTPPDDSWTWVKTVADATALMEAGEVAEASLDHDLGEDVDGRELPEGRTLIYWMAEHECWPTKAITVHSANPVGVDYMLGMIERYGPFARVGRTRRFVRSGQ
jgi:hypothetical protein